MDSIKSHITIETEDGVVQFDAISTDGELAFSEETDATTRKLACALGMHAYLAGVCVNCGKKK